MKKFTDMQRIRRLKPYIPFLFLLLLMLAAHGTVAYSRDDVLFRAALDVGDGWTFLADRYYNWSSRSFIEGVMIYILDIDSFPLWKMLNCLLFLPLAWSIGRLTQNKEAGGGQSMGASRFPWFLTALILLYPYGYDMSTSGWAATTMNYFWPLAFLLLAVLPIRKQLDGERLRWYEFLCYLPAFLYAVNAEQTCVILIGVYGVFLLWQLTRRRFRPLFLAGLLLGLAGLAWILLCPGNRLRTAEELSRFVDYPMLGLTDKIDLGFSISMAQLLCRPNLLYCFFSIMLAAKVWQKYETVLLRLAASVPAACGLVLGMFAGPLEQVYPELSGLTAMTDYGVITVENYVDYKSYLPFFIMGGVLLCILISLYYLYWDEYPQTGLLAAFVFLLGVGSKAMMAFSPTVWASNTRTNIYLDFSMIIVCCLLYTYGDWKEKPRRQMEWLAGILAVFSYAMQFTVMC